MTGLCFGSARPRDRTPPPFNGGVMNVPDEGSLGLGGPPRFDKYEATVFRPDREVLQTLQERWASNTHWVETPHKVSNYGFLRTGTRWEMELGVKYGGSQPHPWVQSNLGTASPKLAGIVREWPHKVTRVDVKFDIQGEGAFEYAVSVADEIRRQQPIVAKMTVMGDVDGIDGRSVYIGSGASLFQCNIYEKSKQLFVKKNIVVPDNIVRIEGRFKPQTKEQGIAMAKLEPEEYWASVRLGRQIFESLSKRQIPRLQLPQHQTQGDDASAVSMLAQYLKVCDRLQVREGGWEKFGAYLGHLRDEAEELARERSSKIRTRNDVAKS